MRSDGRALVAVLLSGYLPAMSPKAARTDIEICLRCSAPMEWRHGTWQCPSCRFKIGCCEGETGECADPPR